MRLYRYTCKSRMHVSHGFVLFFSFISHKSGGRPVVAWVNVFEALTPCWQLLHNSREIPGISSVDVLLIVLYENMQRKGIGPKNKFDLINLV